MDRHRIYFLLDERSIRFRVHCQLFKLIQRLKSVDDPAEDGVLEIEGWLGCVGDEKLALVGIDTGVGHGNKAALAVLEILLEFVVELLAPYGFSTFSGVRGIARLNNESFYVSGECTAVVIIRRA